MSKNKGQGITASIIYKTMERYVMMAFQLIVQIVIARILEPSDYGLVAMMTVFIAIANVFVQNGFNMAVVQKKNAKEIDYDTALTVNLLIGFILYFILFVFAPNISTFYNQPELKTCLRVLALVLPIGSISSIQIAVATRFMMFRNLFVCNIFAGVISGVLGIIMALGGFGYWALVVQQLSSLIALTIALLLHATWKPRFRFLYRSAKEMFTFGWKMLAAGLINTIYLELNSLIIGKRYTSSDLSFYTKGKAFPRSLTSGVDSALQSVMLSSFSKKQDNREELHRLMKMSAVTNTYVLTPILVFLAVAGAPIISLLLTDKWLPMLPYMQIACFSLAFHPLSSINMQVIAAVGRSDLRLKLEFIKKPIGLILLAVAISYGPLAIAISSAIASFVGLIIGFIACKKIVGYKISNSFKDIIPSWLAALSSGLFVYALNLLVVNNFLLLIIQLIVMACTYYVISKIFKLIGYQICKEKISTICQKK